MDWHSIGIGSTLDWHHIGMDWPQIGMGRRIGSGLALDQQQIELISDWQPIGVRLGWEGLECGLGGRKLYNGEKKTF